MNLVKCRMCIGMSGCLVCGLCACILLYVFGWSNESFVNFKVKMFKMKPSSLCVNNNGMHIPVNWLNVWLQQSIQNAFAGRMEESGIVVCNFKIIYISSLYFVFPFVISLTGLLLCVSVYWSFSYDNGNSIFIPFHFCHLFCASPIRKSPRNGILNSRPFIEKLQNRAFFHLTRFGSCCFISRLFMFIITNIIQMLLFLSFVRSNGF